MMIDGELEAGGVLTWASRLHGRVRSNAFLMCGNCTVHCMYEEAAGFRNARPVKGAAGSLLHRSSSVHDRLQYSYALHGEGKNYRETIATVYV